ncbi:3-oxoadipate enol-lactonase 2 [Streptomyces sp. YIM 130001]|uniref:alpha/beta fold hydrolase n=1 Tax=Streptomyces sp. YIM 130001 TaxID=2259644 RepID=UPI000E651F2C|nr:alpha/beta hydrolase [Streptomyces sp. YIM 130001]RII13109.1 3-oxoadipate enol-lactonase 2 [Streptomyces sp. YIM 130001]
MVSGRAPGIVLVHGTRFSAAQWSPQLGPLREEFDVEAVDLPGHGARRGEPWSLAAAAEVVAEAVDALGRGPALVVGHSLGGYVGLEFARVRPELLGGLVLAGASASTRGRWATPYRWVAGLVPRVSEERLTRWNDWLLRRMYTPDVAGPTVRAGYGFAALPAAWGEVLGRFGAEAMRDVAAPVLILNGEKDMVFRAGEREFAAEHPQARIELIPRARHLVNFDQPEAFTDAVRRFARELDTA